MRKLYYLLLGVKFCLVRRGVSVTDGGQKGRCWRWAGL